MREKSFELQSNDIFYAVPTKLRSIFTLQAINFTCLTELLRKFFLCQQNLGFSGDDDVIARVEIVKILFIQISEKTIDLSQNSSTFQQIILQSMN